MSSGLELASRGYSVTVLDRGQRSTESSWSGGGILFPLLPWNYASPVNRLAQRAVRAYPSWISRLETLTGRNTEYWTCGMKVLEVDATDRARAASWCQSHDVRLDYEPPDTLWLPDIAQVRNPRLLDTAHAATLKLGVTLYEHLGTFTLKTKDRRILSLTSPHGEFPVDNLVIATGAWAGLALDKLAPVPNIRPIRGQMLLFKIEPRVLETILFRDGLYLIPRRDGHILVGSTLEDAGFDKSIDPDTAQHLHAQASELLPSLAAHPPIQHWSGLRPGSPGNIPIIGPHPDYDNVFINAGHYRYGLTMAPAAAELLADLIEDKTPALDPTPYSWAAAQQRQWDNRL